MGAQQVRDTIHQELIVPRRSADLQATEYVSLAWLRGMSYTNDMSDEEYEEFEHIVLSTLRRLGEADKPLSHDDKQWLKKTIRDRPNLATQTIPKAFAQQQGIPMSIGHCLVTGPTADAMMLDWLLQFSAGNALSHPLSLQKNLST